MYFELIKTKEKFYSFIEILKCQKFVVIDTETSGLNVWENDRLCGIGFCFENENSYYLPFRHKETPHEFPLLSLLNEKSKIENLSTDYLPILFNKLSKIPKLIGHNIKFDLAVLCQDGFQLGETQEIEDTIIGARLYLREKEPDLKLDSLISNLISTEDYGWKKKFKQYLEDNKIKNHYDCGAIEIVGEYCARDCYNTLKLYKLFKEHLIDTKQENVYEDESKVLKILFEMEKHGSMIDLEYCNSSIVILNQKKDDILNKIRDEFGIENVNFNSNDQLSSMFDKLGINSVILTKTGKQSWNEVALENVDHPIASYIILYRKIEKLLDTYFLRYSKIPFGKVHPYFKSWGTITGRMSCTNPNLQQIAKPDKEISVNVRGLFKAPDGFSLVAADYSQMEMRVFADYIKDKNVLKALEEDGFDFHDHVTKQVWGIDKTNENWSKYRGFAKNINFGLIYGIGTKKLAYQIGKTEEEALQYKYDYFKALPTANSFIKQVSSVIQTRGYIFNRFGRRYYLTEEESYKGVNYLVQGTSADIVKRSMIRIDNLFRKQQAKSRICIQIHDEFIFYIANDEFNDIIPEIKNCMEFPEINAKLLTDFSICLPSWDKKMKLCEKHNFVIKGVDCNCE